MNTENTPSDTKSEDDGTKDTRDREEATERSERTGSDDDERNETRNETRDERRARIDREIEKGRAARKTGTKPAVRRVPSGEPDHSGVAEHRERTERRETEAREGRSERRKRIKSGHLSGKWVVIGSSLVNLDAAAKIDLPSESDPEESRTLTITTFGGTTVSASGEEAAEVMEELGLSPTPAKSERDKSETEVHREDGRVISARDAEAEEIPGRVESVPTGPHRANAVLGDAETDYDVENRAGGNPIPPTREIPIPTGERTTGERATGEADGNRSEGDDADRTGEPAVTGERGTGTRETGRGSTGETASERASRSTTPKGGKRGRK